MSKKVNIMADVDQTIYDAVVTPHKQSRTFTTLVETLLRGYYSNAYIRSFVDDELEGIQHEASDMLNDLIGSMHKSLANMGVYTDELKVTSQDGIDAFSQKAEETKKDMENIQSSELQQMKDSVEELKSQNAEIMEMLKSFMVSGAKVIALENNDSVFNPLEEASVVPEWLDEVPDLSDVEEGIVEVAESTETIAVDESVPTIEEGIGVNESEAKDIMANLLIGQEYSF